jgi:glycosyltransferase involved in cell wall biosynthesis
VRVGLLPANANWVGGPGTYLSGLVDGLTRIVPPIELRILLLGLGQLRRDAAHHRRVLRSRLSRTAQVPVVTRPVSPRLYSSKTVRALLDLDTLFGRHDVYHQAHLDGNPAVRAEKLALTLHDVIAADWPDEGSLLSGAEDLLRRAAAVITVSEASKGRILGRFPRVHEERVRVIWNGLDHSAFYPGPTPGDSALLRDAGVPSEYILYVGGMTRRKNVEALVRGHARLRRRRRDAPPLVLVGPWDKQRFIDAAPAALESDVVALGPVPAVSVPALMRGAQVLAAPSRDEGFGLPVLEGQACGTTVVCSNIPVFREIGGAAPLYVPPTDQGLAEGLDRALDLTSDEIRERQRLGLEHTRTFTWERSAEQHCTVYREIALRG